VRIAFDVDGVIVDIQPKILLRVNQELGTAYEVDDIDEWDYQKTLGPTGHKIAWQVINSEDLYDDLHAEADVLAVAQRFAQAGHDVIFVSAATEAHATSKLRFLTSRKCNSIPLKNIVLTHDKTRVDFDILIDDRTSTVESLPGRALLWDQPWNRKDAKPETPRVSNAAELERVIFQRGPAAKESVTLEAERLVNGNRQADYGHPLDDFSQTALMWTGLFQKKLALGERFTAEDVPQAMIAVKLSRLQNRLKRDSIVDVAGYAATLELVIKERERREHSQHRSQS
jgi:5'(3')-deoxyribonucleotidase